ncbi:MAG TPA: hypothetical protein PK733_12285 [Clostridiales bacterium]|nr:hypothetical protein [Clostridiales bacterium]
MKYLYKNNSYSDCSYSNYFRKHCIKNNRSLYILISYLIIVVILITGCGDSNKHKTEDDQLAVLKQELESKNSEIESLNKQLKSMQEELDIKNDELNKTRFELESFHESKEQKNEGSENQSDVYDNHRKTVSLADIKLGYTMEQVSGVLGKNYKESEWEHFGDIKDKMWTYDNGVIIRLNRDMVYSIELTNAGYRTSFDVMVGDSALESINKCKKVFKEFVSIHSGDNKPNLGWFYTDNDEMIVLYFNKENNRFNDGVELSEKTKVEKIELLYVSSFD